MQRVEVKTEFNYYKHQGDDIEYRVDDEDKLTIIVYKLLDGDERKKIAVAEYRTWQYYEWSEVEENDNENKSVG